MSKTLKLVIFLTLISFSGFSQGVVDTLYNNDYLKLQNQGETDADTPFRNYSDIKSSEIPTHGNLQLLTLLQNRSAGLTIFNNSGAPGTSISTTIRGRKSFYNDYSPLILLDGLPINNSERGKGTAGTDQSNRLIDINPNDIESVRVIKGSVGAVLYGVRGANGVIILTSKKGSTKKPRITISSEISTSKVGKLPERQSEYAQGRAQSGIHSYRGPETAEADTWGPAISTLEYDGDPNYDFDKKGRLVPLGFGNGTPSTSYDPYLFFQDAMSSNLNASISGSSSLLNYYVSGGSNTVNGVIPKTNYNRNSIFGSVNSNITNKLNINFSARYILSEANRNQSGSNIKGVMLGLLRTPPSFDNANGFSTAEAINNVTAYTKADGGQRSYRNGVYDNPFWSINNNPHNDKVNRLISSTSINYKLNNDISFIVNGGIDSYTDTREGGTEINPGRDQGSVYAREIEYTAKNIDLMATVNKSFISNLESKFQIGLNYFDTKTINNSSESGELLSSGNISLSNAKEIITIQNTISTKNLGFLSSLDLVYNKYLNVNLSVRQDYSSTIGSNQKGFLSYGIFSSLDVFKTFNSEDQDANSSKLIVFAGYGRSGLQAPISRTLSSFEPTLISGDGFIRMHDIDNTQERSDISGNPDLKAEKTDAFEVGFSMNELSNRVIFNATYYNEKTSDIVMIRSIAPSSGFNLLYDNSATIRNKGIELSLSVVPIETNNLSWTLIANLTKNENTIEEIDIPNLDAAFLQGFTSTASYFQEGQPYGAIFGTGFLQDDDGNTVIGSDGFPLADSNQKVLGDPNPNFILGIENQFTINSNLKIGILLDIKQGGDMWCGTCGIMNYFGVSQLSADERGQTMVFEGVNVNGSPNTQEVELTGPSITENEFFRRRYGFGGIGGMNIHDASWIRIRRLDLSYDFSHFFNKTKFIHSFSVGLYADNVWLSTDYPGIDPETNLTGNSNGFGLDYFNNPSTKSFGVSINLTL